ncbi:hypothetical protein ABE10_01830, partial [Bacillus toyonensis]|nr:hypothetical protein [Bacillus toyonensis]
HGKRSVPEELQDRRQEGRDRDRPGEHAPRAERADLVEALRDQPADEGEGEGDPEAEQTPEPSRESSTGEKGDADDERRHPAGEADDGVGEAEDRSLPRVEVRAALHKDAEVAAEGRIRVLQLGDLVQGELERRPPPDDAGDDQPDGEADGAGVLRGHGEDYRRRSLCARWGVVEGAEGRREARQSRRMPRCADRGAIMARMSCAACAVAGI